MRIASSTGEMKIFPSPGLPFVSLRGIRDRRDDAFDIGVAIHVDLEFYLVNEIDGVVSDTAR